MKKAFLIASVAGLALVSCKKDYTCECTTTDNGTVLSTTTFTGKMKKKDSETWCTNNVVTSGTTKMECKLK
jgi:hypothetical protein